MRILNVKFFGTYSGHLAAYRRRVNPEHFNIAVEVNFDLEQAMKAQRGSRCIALIFLQPRHWIGEGGQRHVPASLLQGKRPGTHCIGGCVGPRAGLEG